MQLPTLTAQQKAYRALVLRRVERDAGARARGAHEQLERVIVDHEGKGAVNGQVRRLEAVPRLDVAVSFVATHDEQILARHVQEALNAPHCANW